MMKYAVAAVGAAALVSAAPASKRAYDDATVLQYALTLEHLEDTFYHQYLNQFSAADFAAAGFPDWVRGRLSQVAAHEAQHVAFLTAGLTAAGATPVAACTYKFPVTDVKSFVALATVVENVGTSAYLGAAASIKTPGYLTAAGSILTTEARHQGWLSSAVSKNSPWSGPEDTPLSFNEVYSIVLPFFVSCPSSNGALPFKAYPALTIAADGTVTSTVNTAGTYVQVKSGLTTKVYPVTNGKVSIPAIQGIYYAVLTSSSDASKVTDDNTLAGPMIFRNVFTSKVENTVF